MADLSSRAALCRRREQVLLAGMEDDEIRPISIAPITAFQIAITDHALLWREVRAIRKRGFAEKGELFPGGGALAAPIRFQRNLAVLWTF
jgi:DNA-binding IclR family transcriptional regulator